MDPESVTPSPPPELFFLLFQQAADGMFVADPEGRLVAVNPRLCDFLGYAAEEALGRPFQDFADLEDLRTNPLRIAELRAGASVVSERLLRCKDGRLIPVDLTTRMMPDGHLLGVARDITERKRVEEEAKANHLRLLSVLDASLDPVYVADPETFEVLYVNRALADVFGPPDQRRCYEYLQHRDSPCPFCTNDRIFGEAFGKVFSWEFQNEATGRWYRCLDRAITWPDGRVVRYETTTDLTEHKQAGDALRESERRLSSVLETMSLISVMLDTEGRITFCNDYLLNLTGWTREEALGQIWFESFLPPEARDEVRNEVFLKTIQAGEVPVHFENEIVTRRGERRLVAWNNTVLRDPAGKVTGTASVGEDITDRKRTEDARLEMERRLLHAQKLESLGVLAGGIAHDFNNLLMAILGNLELGLHDLSPVSPAWPRLGAASHAARRAADLTRQMLAYSGRGKFMVVRVDLNELVEENVHLLRTSISRTATLNLQLDRALPAVEADIGQIQQVIMNLITNASEAVGGQPGVITLSTGVRDCDGSYLGRSRLVEIPPAGRYSYFEVTDTGCGMDEETQKRMFEPFFTTKFTGRGLGLPAVFGIVRGHGGAILLDSAVGKGTTIRVLFPVAEPAPGVAVPAEDAPAGVSEAAGLGTSRGTILIVDDEEMVLQPCAAMVKSMGFAVLTASDGEQAVEAVRRHGAEIRAIILDLTMPKLDGAGAFERILRIEPGAKVILSSGYDEAEATGRLAKERLAGFIRKPYHLALLRSTLERVLGTVL
jgi:PAS domain S-box-containing protein